MSRLLASPLRNLAAGSAFMLAVSLSATLAYIACGWSFSDAAYMVVMTVYTVGYGEVRPIDTPSLRLLTMTLIVTGCTGMIFVTGSLVQLITASQFQQFLGGRRMQKDIDGLSGHVIVCGFGRIGQMLARDLRAGQARFVILERDQARVDAAREGGYLTVQGDATDEESLRQAGVARARALATVLPDDAANVFITLSARGLNASLTIIARGEAPSTERKLIQAGADRVVLPAHIGAERIAELLLYQDLAAMLDGSVVHSAGGRDLRRMGLELEVVSAALGSRSIGCSVRDVEQHVAGAFLIVALDRQGGEGLLQPSPSVTIEEGDGVAIVGRAGRAEAMAAWFGSPVA